jgi:hypothetical protein
MSASTKRMHQFNASTDAISRAGGQATVTREPISSKMIVATCILRATHVIQSLVHSEFVLYLGAMNLYQQDHSALSMTQLSCQRSS